MKKILITGSKGFIGKNLYEGLLELYDIYAPKRNELNLLDSVEVEKYLKENKFDVIIHSANQNNTRNRNVSEYQILDGNLRMFFNLEKCKNHYGKMYYFGSGAEYDMNNYIPMMKEEYFGVNIPKDPYGYSKYIMSKISEQDNNIYDLRLFGVFGKYEEWERRFISNVICMCIFDLPIKIKQNVTFDYLYIEDLVKIMIWFIENTPSRKHYNICTSNRIDLLTIAKKILNFSQKDLEIIIQERGIKREYSGDNRRFLIEVENFKFTEIDKSIEKLFEYYSNNKSCINEDLLKI